jgi:hypothetical protein
MECPLEAPYGDFQTLHFIAFHYSRNGNQPVNDVDGIQWAVPQINCVSNTNPIEIAGMMES